MPSIRKKAVLRSKPGRLDLLIISLIVLLNLFTLPSLSRFLIYPRPKTASSQILGSTLYHYEHPSIPLVKSTTSPPLSAQSFILLDSATNSTLLTKNPRLRVYPASTTKLATALTALNIYPLDEIISIGSTYSEGKVMELRVGEKITARSLVEALLVYSANDAAYNLAQHHSQGSSGFITEMNLLLTRSHLSDTRFTNYDGIHQPNHYSTVADLSQLARLSIKNSVITQVVKLSKLTVTDIDNQIHHQLQSTNQLLGVVPEIEGLKTGWTPEAGGCFIGLINIGGHKLISVVAQSQDRFADTRALVTWAKENVTWQPYSP